MTDEQQAAFRAIIASAVEEMREAVDVNTTKFATVDLLMGASLTACAVAQCAKLLIAGNQELAVALDDLLRQLLAAIKHHMVAEDLGLPGGTPKPPTLN